MVCSALRTCNAFYVCARAIVIYIKHKKTIYIFDLIKPHRVWFSIKVYLRKKTEKERMPRKELMLVNGYIYNFKKGKTFLYTHR